MYFAYADETGIDGNSPAIVMAAIVVNDQRLTRTQVDFAAIFKNLGDLATGTLHELKSSDLLAGTGAWRKVEPATRVNVVSNLCSWLGDRKHGLAVAAIEHQKLLDRPPPVSQLVKPWPAAAFHLALQLQKAHQALAGSKGRTVLVFDNNEKGLFDIAQLVHDPPAWSDDYYGRQPKSGPLDRLIDTPFAVKSHHVGLVQVADVFAAVLRRYTELEQYGMEAKYDGEREHVLEWVGLLAPRMLPKAHRWPSRSPSQCARWYSELAPAVLLNL